MRILSFPGRMEIDQGKSIDAATSGSQKYSRMNPSLLVYLFIPGFGWMDSLFREIPLGP